MVSSLHRGSAGKPGRGLVLPGLERERERESRWTLKPELFRLWELCEGNLRRGNSLNGDPEEYVKEVSGISLYGAPLGNP
jgi:hypothetical protein